MLGNFTYCNPTKLYFGEDSLAGLNKELPKYGQNVQLVYGGGSIKKNGIYDKVMELLKANGKPNKIWEEQLSKNLVVRYMKYDDGRIFVFDIKKQPYRFCRVEITNPEYRFGRKKIGIGTSKKKIEKVYKKSYRGLHQDELRKHKYLVEDGNREIVFYFNEDYKVNKIVIGDAEIYHGTQGWKRKKK